MFVNFASQKAKLIKSVIGALQRYLRGFRERVYSALTIDIVVHRFGLVERAKVSKNHRPKVDIDRAELHFAIIVHCTSRVGVPDGRSIEDVIAHAVFSNVNGIRTIQKMSWHRARSIISAV